jgi:prepilin-type N-terminal cleavage/methylation domain-containing protein
VIFNKNQNLNRKNKNSCKNNILDNNKNIMKTLHKTKNLGSLSLRCLLGKNGFSLVELLVALAVIGVIAGLAMPSIAGVVAGGRSAKEKRQAQSVALTFAAARSAGAHFPVATREGIVDALTTPGGVQGSGVLADVSFSVPVAASEQSAVRSSPCLVDKRLQDGSMILEFHPAY